MRHLKTLGVVVSLALCGHMAFAGAPASTAVVAMDPLSASAAVDASSCMGKSDSLDFSCVMHRVLAVVKPMLIASSDDGAANEVVVCEAESVKSRLNPMNMSE